MKRVIKQLVIDNETTMSQAADKLGITHTYIYGSFPEKTENKVKQLREIVEALGGTLEVKITTKKNNNFYL
jgi:DNA-binding phage protein